MNQHLKCSLYAFGAFSDALRICIGKAQLPSSAGFSSFSFQFRMPLKNIPGFKALVSKADKTISDEAKMQTQVLAIFSDFALNPTEAGAQTFTNKIDELVKDVISEKASNPIMSNQWGTVQKRLSEILPLLPSAQKDFIANEIDRLNSAP